MGGEEGVGCVSNSLPNYSGSPSERNHRSRSTSSTHGECVCVWVSACETVRKYVCVYACLCVRESEYACVCA